MSAHIEPGYSSVRITHHLDFSITAIYNMNNNNTYRYEYENNINRLTT